MNREITFRFKQFALSDSNCGMKTGTDGVTLGAWADCTNARYIIDVGAGSGLIALMMAQRSKARITAVEIDPGAAGDAGFNIESSPWSNRINVVSGDICRFVPATPPDLIISNPPFFCEGEMSADCSRAGARHEASLTYRTLIQYASSHLAADGRLALIAPAERCDGIIYNAEMLRLKVRRQCYLFSKPQARPFRVMLEIMRHDGPIDMSSLTIRDSSGKYTPEFKQLTKDFYL